MFKQCTGFVRSTVLSSWFVLAVAAMLSPVPASAQSEAPSPRQVEKPALIDVNKASAKELVKLPRIGPVVAKRIVDHRKVFGRFAKLDELLNIKGIGVRTLETIKPFVTLGPPPKSGSRKGRRDS